MSVVHLASACCLFFPQKDHWVRTFYSICLELLRSRCLYVWPEPIISHLFQSVQYPASFQLSIAERVAQLQKLDRRRYLFRIFCSARSSGRYCVLPFLACEGNDTLRRVHVLFFSLDLTQYMFSCNISDDRRPARAYPLEIYD